MTPNELFDDFSKGFPARKFAAGLLLAFIDFYRALGVPKGNYKDFQAVLHKYPRELNTAQGRRANTLIVNRGNQSTLSLRPFYNEAERLFRAEHQRFDYPSCAPHATQAWNDYLKWLDALAGFSEQKLAKLRDDVVEFVLLKLPSQAFDPSSVSKEPPLFQMILDGFEMKVKGEVTGAAFQGIVFGFLRADNPHLQIEIDKVRTGSKRLQRVGDIDGWDGARLALTVEVKQFEFKDSNVSDLKGFANASGQRGALGILAALSFSAGVRGTVESLGLKALDIDDLLRIVELWDPIKQRIAVASFVYYAGHVEKSSSLSSRLGEFLKQAALGYGAVNTVSPKQ